MSRLIAKVNFDVRLPESVTVDEDNPPKLEHLHDFEVQRFGRQGSFTLALLFRSFSRQRWQAEKKKNKRQMKRFLMQ